MTILKPMLAEAVEEEQFKDLRWPLIATKKIDGIRCLMVGGKALSRKFLPIPNKHIRETLENSKLTDGMDGELLVPGNFQNQTSGIMSFEGEPDFRYHVFDLEGGNRPYVDRLARLKNHISFRKDAGQLSFLEYVPERMLYGLDDFMTYRDELLAQDEEGMCLRDPQSPYKFGRSTFKEHYLLKVKFLASSECLIEGFEEAMENTNTAKKDNTGHTKRSSAKAGKVPKNTLGAFVCFDPTKNWRFNCGTGEGLNDVLKKDIWDNKSRYLGKMFTYRYQPKGSKDAPRGPSFHGFRDIRDM